MLIVCQNCGTSYQIDPATLGPAGRSVRCARCQHVWFSANTAALAAIAQAHREEVGALPPDTGAENASDVSEVSQANPQPIPDGRWETVDAAAPDAPVDEQVLPKPDLGETDLGETDRPAPSGSPIDDSPPSPSPSQPEPVAILDAPPLVPLAPAAGEDIEAVAARRARRPARRRRWRWPIPAASTAVLALVAINMGLIAWRADVVRWLPQTASLYAALRMPVNLRGLAFTEVTSTSETHEGVQVLLVEGTIASTGARVVEVPRLRFAVRNASGNEIYTWTALPARSVLAPGETLAFRSRLASPPRETHDVVVRFFNRHDLLAGIQ